MPIAVSYETKVTVQETLGGVFVDPADATVTTVMTTTKTLNPGSTPPASKYSAGDLTLSTGAGTIDLTSLPDANGVAAAVTLSGLKIAAAKFRNPSTNANSMTIAKGASSGFTGFGSAFSHVLQPGAEIVIGHNNAAGDVAVAGGNKTLDVTGTGSQVLEFEFVAG